MYSLAMEFFLSKENLNLHFSYLNDLKLKYSILEKSGVFQGGNKIKGNYSEVKKEAKNLRKEIDLHEIYFSSFAKNSPKCDFLKRFYSSKESFLYEIFVTAKHCESDFLIISRNKIGKPFISNSDDFSGVTSILALDLSEHAYFFDYAFNKDEYIKRALNYLDLSKLEIN